jgi:catechol 2,3-dioxygenase-like lactoylglutathione lyase family enzyme
MAIKIKEIQLFANNIESLKHFYSEIMGLPVSCSTNISVTFQAGASLLTFTESEAPVHPYYHFAFNISENKKDKSIHWLKARGIGLNLIEGKEDYHSLSWNAHSIYFYDPAGNIVEFIARHSLENHSDGDFTSSDILNISEIGFAVEDVGKVVEYLQSYYKEQIYISSNSMFAPIGDEEGLLILSSLKRNWLGSNKKVEISPLEIIISGERNEESSLLHYPYKIITGI